MKFIKPNMIKINIYFVIIYFVFMGLLFSYYNPLWCSPDEERHFGYCEYLAQKGRLPLYTTDPEPYSLNMGFHPPLYYFLTSFFCEKDTIQLKNILRVNDGPGYAHLIHPRSDSGPICPGKVRSAYVIRFFSIILGAITLLLIYRMALIILPGEPVWAAACALFVATIPQFQQMSSSISNQSLMTLFSTVFILCLLHYINNPEKWKWRAGTGLFLGLCFLTRSAAILFIPLTLFALAWVWFRNKKNTLLDGTLILGTGFLLSSWWYIRNYLVCKDPLLSKAFLVHQPWISQKVPATLDYFWTVLTKTYTSFFGALGSTAVQIPLFCNIVYGLILVLAVAGLCCFLLKLKDVSFFQRQALGFLFLAFAGAVAQYTIMNMQYFGMFLGRYFFIVLAPFAVLTFTGLRFLLPASVRDIFFTMLSVLLIMLNIYVCFMVLRPAYADTRLEQNAAQISFCCATPPINTQTAIGQSFSVSADNLCAVRVLFAEKESNPTGDITFTLREGTVDGPVLHCLTYSLKRISESQRLVFIFPPIKHSAGKKYVAVLNSSAGAGKGIQLWHEASDNYPNGSLLLNGRPVAGDLYFNTYCFSGKTPRTIWQGKTPAVINQGNFIGIGELQFYLDLAPGQQQKIITHKKLAVIRAAIKKGSSEFVVHDLARFGLIYK